MYYLACTQYKDELYHHGVKGQKWGVRKSIENSIQVRGYRMASRYVQKKDIQKLKQKQYRGQITRAQYRARKQQIKTNAMIARGKHMVDHNQTFMNTAVKGLAGNAAVNVGAAIVTGMGGAPVVVPVAIGATAMKIDNTNKTIGKMKDLNAYTVKRR